MERYDSFIAEFERTYSYAFDRSHFPVPRPVKRKIERARIVNTLLGSHSCTMIRTGDPRMSFDLSP